MLLLEKKCSKCGRMLPVEMFHKNGGSRLRSHCRDCDAQRSMARSASKKQVDSQSLKQRKEAFNAVAKHSIYFIASSFKPEHVKIGHTSNLHQRMMKFLCGTSGNILLLSLVEAESYRDELPYHRKFQNLRIGDTEWFMAKSPLLRFLSSLDQYIAYQSLSVLTPSQQSRIIIPSIDSWIDSLPFLG
jgi:hypothetical protein